jgi:hypothetical protein
MAYVQTDPYITSRPHEQIVKEREETRKFGEKLLRTRGAARAFLLKGGFITKDNKISRRYR